MDPDRIPDAQQFDTVDDDELVPVLAGTQTPAESPSQAEAPERSYKLLSPQEADRAGTRSRAPKRSGSPWDRPPARTATPSEPAAPPGDGRDPGPWQGRVLLGVAVLAMGVAGFLAGWAFQPPTPPAPSGPAWPTMTDGIPGGFAPGPQGAQAAAAAFAALFSDSVLSDPARLREVLDAISAPGAGIADAAGRAADAYAQRRTELGLPPDGSVRLRTFPLTVSAAEASGGRAEVEVWAATVLAADGVRAPTAGFLTYRFTLVWSGSDWQVDDLTVHPLAAGAALPPELDFASLLYVPAEGGPP